MVSTTANIPGVACCLRAAPLAAHSCAQTHSFRIPYEHDGRTLMSNDDSKELNHTTTIAQIKLKPSKNGLELA